MSAAVPSLRVVIAPDKFKGTLTAAQAAAAIATGVRAAAPTATMTEVPVADGGEGTIEALLAAGATEHVATVTGPLGRPTRARFAQLEDTVFIEAAQACGLLLVQPTAESAMRAHSSGVGELLLAALDAGARRVVIGLGGVACTDGGAGMAQALGARLLDENDSPIGPGGEALLRLRNIQLSDLDPRISETEIVAATDVQNPLTGPAGAATVYGPQKGAGPAEVSLLDRALTHYARTLERATHVSVAELPGAGAAGGLGAGMAAFLGARIASGCELVLDLLHVADALAGADVVLTGEGKLDDQSLFGKAPVGVADLANSLGTATIAVAGIIAVTAPEGLVGRFHSWWSLVEQVGQDKALADPAEALSTVTATAVRNWLRERGIH